MADIKGTIISFPNLGISDETLSIISYYSDDVDDDINGTSDADTIDGLGGDDNIWGGLGNDVIQGGYGSDIIKPTDQNVDTVADWGYDEVHGGPGDDWLLFEKTTHHVLLQGGEGVDTIKGGSDWDSLDGGSEGDFIWGFGGDDKIWGRSGDDHVWGGKGEDFISGGKNDDTLDGGENDDEIWGGDGTDTILGGYGNDELLGEAGQDTMTGGPGSDTFQFHMQDSDPSNPDHITDFLASSGNVYFAGDKIDFLVGEPGGTSSNYLEFSIRDGGYNEAKNVAGNWFAGDHLIGGGVRYLFITDGVDGYLFSDPFGNGTIQDGIILDGLNELSDFSHFNIL
jgi:Ca2+-binding RTX toxin-like protein